MPLGPPWGPPLGIPGPQEGTLEGVLVGADAEGELQVADGLFSGEWFGSFTQKWCSPKMPLLSSVMTAGTAGDVMTVGHTFLCLRQSAVWQRSLH